MTKKDLIKQHSGNNGHVISDKGKEKKLPKSAFSKFIALPKGLKVKSGDNLEQAAPKKLVPVKAVPLRPAQADYTYTEHIGVSTTYTPGQAEPREIIDHNPGSQQSAQYTVEQRRTSVSSSTGSTGTHNNGSVRSLQSDSSYAPRYRKRSSSTPPDIGRRQPSPVDRRIDKVVKDYYTNLYNSVNNNGDNYSNGNIGDIDLDHTGDLYDSAVVTLDHGLDGDSLDSDDLHLTQVLNSWDSHTQTPVANTRSPYTGSVDSDINMTSAPGLRQQSKLVVHPHYLTLPRNTGSQVAQTLNFHQHSNFRPGMAYTNGTLPRGGVEVGGAYPNGSVSRGSGGRVVYMQPTSHSNQAILMGHTPRENGTTPRNQQATQDNRQGNLYKSKVLSSSMPTLLDGMSKSDKKLFKEIKRQEEKERRKKEKEREKELKKKLKEEKKLQKALKKAKTRTLPRNWGYVNKPIENVYSTRSVAVRPSSRMSLSAVNIDFEDTGSVVSAATSRGGTPAPTHAPPPPPTQPSYKTQALYSSAPDLLRLEQVYGATLRGVPSEIRTYATPNGRATFVKEPNNYVR